MLNYFNQATKIKYFDYWLCVLDVSTLYILKGAKLNSMAFPFSSCKMQWYSDITHSYTNLLSLLNIQSKALVVGCLWSPRNCGDACAGLGWAGLGCTGLVMYRVICHSSLHGHNTSHSASTATPPTTAPSIQIPAQLAPVPCTIWT